MSTQNLWYYCEQLHRIVLESLEVSFMVCKAELEEYTIAKVSKMIEIFYIYYKLVCS